MTKLAEVMTRDPVVLPSDAGLDEAGGPRDEGRRHR